MSAAEVTVNLGEEAEESAIPTSDNPDPTSALAEALLDEDENAAGNAVASVFTRIRELTSENATLRSELNDERESKLTLLEVNRELDWRVRTGSSASADTSAAAEEWKKAEESITWRRSIRRADAAE